jgi:phosphatidylserine decarboxylase
MSNPKFFKDWLPKSHEALDKWRKKIQEKAQKQGDQRLPVIQEFSDLIESDPVVRMYITRMIEQIPPKYKTYHPKSVAELLQWLNAVLTTAPDYNNTEAVGTPLSAILMWTMGDPAGFAAYRNEKINLMLKKILAAWTVFLDSPESVYVLNPSPDGWQSEAAMKQLQMQDYQYNPDAPFWGFSSWNQFFTRPLSQGARPIAEPKNNKVVVSACDSTVYVIEDNVQRYSQFWLKSQPHSLSDMLGDAKEYVDAFVDGTVYQAFLSPFNYHRWHSPVSGTIRKAFVQEGLYFSQADSEGEDPTIQDHSEGYITQVQTRAIIIIEADDKNLGPVCVMPVGMVEISSCIIHPEIALGSHIEKGQELGYFQFGGSTHCVIFRKGAIKSFTAKKNDFKKVGQEIALAH